MQSVVGAVIPTPVLQDQLAKVYSLETAPAAHLATLVHAVVEFVFALVSYL